MEVGQLHVAALETLADEACRWGGEGASVRVTRGQWVTGDVPRRRAAGGGDTLVALINEKKSNVGFKDGTVLS